MSVTTTASTQSFAGGQATLTFTFKTLPGYPQYIKVLAVSGGTETLLTYSSQYTVSLNSDGVGGTVTLSPTYSTGYTHTVYRSTVNKQESDYDDYNQFPADTLENDLDRRTLIDQEQDNANTRSLRLPISVSGVSAELPVPVADAFVGWDSAGTALENKTAADLSAVVKATQADSEAATNDAKYMTPLQVKYEVQKAGAVAIPTSNLTGTFSTTNLTGTIPTTSLSGTISTGNLGGTYSTITLSSVADIYTSAWTDYSGTSTVVGFSGSPTVIVLTKKIGKTVLVAYSITGTSNATSFTFTLPYTSKNNAGFGYRSCGFGYDNGTALDNPVVCYLPVNSATVEIYKTHASSNFTNSGTKTAYGQFFYESA